MKQALADALAKRGYETLTPVQEAVTDPSLEGADLLVSAQTGSGKTVGFGLAIAPTLLGEADLFEAADKPLALVIAPTRELALQVKRELTWLYGEARVVVTSCVGGMDMRDERRALERGAHIVVATPGRLRDHITRGSIDLSGVAAVVLDEADEMLDLGFREDLEFILQETPEERQTLLFSATVSKPIATLAQTYQTDAQRISTINKSEQHSDISYLSHVVAPHDVENAIINVLRFHEAPNAIVFANTRAMLRRAGLDQAADLAGQHIVIPRLAPQERVQPRFRQSQTIERCRIKIPHTAVPRRIKRRARGFISDRLVQVSQGRGAKTQLNNALIIDNDQLPSKSPSS